MVMLNQIWEKLYKAVPAMGMEEATLAYDAARFAQVAHRGQVRSGGQPYVTHVWRVMLAAIDEFVREPLLSVWFVIAAPLHDVVEDCGISLETIEECFGHEVARIVRHVTHHYEDEPEGEYLALVAAGGPKAVRLKRLDKLDNLRDLANADPGFRKQKLAELPIFLALWREIDPEGAEIFRRVAQDYEGVSMRTYYFMIGAPGSGKSMYAKSLGCRIVCPDDIRDAGIRDSAEAFDVSRMMIAHVLSQGENVVFDATNTLRQYRAETIAAGKPYADRVVCVWMDTPLEVCLARHHERVLQGVHMTLPDSVIVRMSKQLADNPPELSEGFDEIFRMRN